MKIKVSNGEIIDKLTILNIKLENIIDQNKLINIKKEFDYLNKKYEKIVFKDKETLYNRLYDINLKLWNVEDDLREKERLKEFDDCFVELAREVYYTNDKRAEIKKEINVLSKSEFTEEKSYEKY